jgi:PhzF family phenazine biosynthesis protein
MSTQMNLLRIAAFSDNNSGGNPAGVLISDALPEKADMQRIAAEVGYSETVFATPVGNDWRVRYFSPESEVPFCGHATIALGAALAQKQGDGVFSLSLINADITVEGKHVNGAVFATLQSPPTRSEPISDELLTEVLDLFGCIKNDLDVNLPPARAHGGADHIVIALNSREALASMQYDINTGRKLMNREGVVTILFAYAETPRLLHTRNPFASGGVYEDPATGAATAALAGYLRDINWPHGGSIEIIQGEDMGMRSRIFAAITEEPGSSIRVSGNTRIVQA